MLLENTTISLPSTSTQTLLTSFCSIRVAFSLVSFSPAVARISPVTGETTSSLSVRPAMRLEISSFLLNLNLPTRARS